MQVSTPSKRPLNESNQNIVFTPFTPGELNPPPQKRRYLKSTRLSFNTPTPSGPQACTSSQPRPHPSRLEETLMDCERAVDSPFSNIPDLPQQQTPSNLTEPEDQHSHFPHQTLSSGNDNIIHDVNNYLQSCGWSLWRFLEALFTSRDQQISSIVSRLLSSHGDELLDAISKKRPDTVKNWHRQCIEHDLGKEGGRIVDELLPPYGETLSSLLSDFSLSTIASRTQARAPLLWKCLTSVGMVSGDSASDRRDRELVSGFFF